MLANSVGRLEKSLKCEVETQTNTLDSELYILTLMKKKSTRVYVE